MTAPYTHADHAAYCREMALQGVIAAGRHVQVRKRGVIYCARLLAPYTTPDGLDCWTVVTMSPESVRITVSCKQVRSCGHGCVCVDSEQQAPVGAGSLASRANPAPEA